MSTRASLLPAVIYTLVFVATVYSMSIMIWTKTTQLLTLVLPCFVSAGSLADIDHVVLFMQENRAFDHYFGTIAGVRGFKDPNVQVNGETSVYYQMVGNLSTKAEHLLPWHLNYLGGSWDNATQCMEG